MPSQYGELAHWGLRSFC